MTTEVDTPVRLRGMKAPDADAVLAIYAEGVATGEATFRTEVPAWSEFSSAHLSAPRLVAVDVTDRVLGWAALSPVSSACAYGGVAELSVYVADGARGRGVGTGLLRGLVERAEEAGLWTLQAGIFPENAASLALHEAGGFRIVGRRERIGRMTHGPHAGQWRDVLLLERRSGIAGTD